MNLRIVAALACLGWSSAAAEVAFVAGATGRTGIEIVGELTAAGYQVRGGTRDAGRARALHGALADWVAADVLDPAALDAAVAGADVVVSALGSSDFVGEGAPQFVQYLGTRLLVDAAKRHQVRQMVVIGAANTGPFEDHARIPRFGYLLYWKTKGEEYLKASGVPFTIVGASGLRDDPGGPGVRLIPRADYAWGGTVSRRRVAEVTAIALRDPAARNTAFALIWDEAVPPGVIAGDFKALQAPERGPRKHEMPKYRW
jgi:uncharacterized protein YbjT (DUF2867 family)